MSAPARAFPLVVTIEHYGPASEPDEFGDHPLVLVDSEEVRCNLQPTSSSDSSDNEARDTEKYNLYLPHGSVLGGQDRVVVAGERLVAIGPGLEFVDFAGVPHHVEATLRRVT